MCGSHSKGSGSSSLIRLPLGPLFGLGPALVGCLDPLGVELGTPRPPGSCAGGLDDPPLTRPPRSPQEELLLDVEDMDVVVEVDPPEGGLDADQQRAATAVVADVLHSIFIAAFHAWFEQLYFTWMVMHGGQFACNLLLLLGAVYCSCSSSPSICLRAFPCFISRR